MAAVRNALSGFNLIYSLVGLYKPVKHCKKAIEKPLSDHTASMETMSQIGTWMQTCETEHQACSEVIYDWRDLPKRLIKIHISEDTARLVESTEIRRDKTRPPRYLTSAIDGAPSVRTPSIGGCC